MASLEAATNDFNAFIKTEAAGSAWDLDNITSSIEVACNFLRAIVLNTQVGYIVHPNSHPFVSHNGSESAQKNWPGSPPKGGWFFIGPFTLSLHEQDSGSLEAWLAEWALYWCRFMNENDVEALPAI
ncbi:hypothetical protein GOP47_0023233 [Adiantum capillus-veneris]|uniref:Uncharacterized protein n=1 Tax=Adiantum capillus-veneris TaxID=13818 RepID=A0A9D4Z630_ADICA|nr:hypothetical protein GOP47_0023233 [Adiantum capillus-veneris]